MEILFLGSGAAEGWPAPYCLCPACEQARRVGGNNIRSRSSILIDADLKIDHGPDTVMQMQRSGRSLAGVGAILFTHEHGDHLDAPELEWASRPYTLTPPREPIEVWGNARVLAEIQRVFPDPEKINLRLKRLSPFEPITTAAGDEVLPLPADHAPDALVLRITRAGKRIFYGHDSGLFPEPTRAALAGCALDVAIFDCNDGAGATSNRNHMGISGVIAMADALRVSGAIVERTRLIATHFSHNGRLLHDELVAALAPHGIAPAHDGMILRVEA